MVYAFSLYINPNNLKATVKDNGIRYYDPIITTRVEQSYFVF